jgi:hypothetical protein
VSWFYRSHGGIFAVPRLVWTFLRRSGQRYTNWETKRGSKRGCCWGFCCGTCRELVRGSVRGDLNPEMSQRRSHLGVCQRGQSERWWGQGRDCNKDWWPWSTSSMEPVTRFWDQGDLHVADGNWGFCAAAGILRRENTETQRRDSIQGTILGQATITI